MSARLNPNKKWWILGGVAAVVLVGGYAYAKSRTPAPTPIPGPRAAVRKAIKMLPGEDSIEIADAAYVMAYPNCPAVLDPDDPTHTNCIGKWLELREMALEELATPQKPKKRPSTSTKNGGSNKGPTAPEPEPKDAPGPAEDMQKWLDSLTPNQRTELRHIVGANYYNPIVQAAKDGDDSGTVTAVIRLKRSIEALVETDKMEAFKKYQELEALLGPKLETLLRAAQKYQN